MKKTILAIDDNKETLFLEGVVLTQAGYQVHTALGGEAALKMIHELKEIDLILLDYEMAGMNGPEFLAALEKQYPLVFEQTPVIYATAHENPPQKLNKSWIPKLRDIDKFIKDVERFITP
ncbi:MAG TPA: response regulator [Pseudobdellovibrionaceae bacterium]|jgi:CheY-like chemotaxis protein